MTNSEIYEHLISVLIDTPNHTIVKHINAKGQHCYRIRDALVNPIANISESIFERMKQNNLLIKLNEREWQLNQQQLNLLNKNRNTSVR